MKKIIFLITFLSFGFIVELKADEFFYKFNKGEKYRIISTVNESIYVNNRFQYNHFFLNKIAIEVVEVKNGSGILEALYQVSGKMENSAYELYEEVISKYIIDPRGHFYPLGNYLYPLARSIPVFPIQDIKPGFSWSALAEEIHDLRQPYGIKSPYKIPISVNYVFNGFKRINEKKLAEFSIQYKYSHQVELTERPSGKFYPVQIKGVVKMLYYWDQENGKPSFYKEEFKVTYIMSSGETVDFIGTAQAELFFSPALDAQKITSDINKEIEKNKLEGVRAEEIPKGVKIVLENIQFGPDSAVITPEERKKIEFIASILKKYPERDIKLVGHTAAVGTPESCLELSIKRAEAVALELLKLGVRKQEQIVIQGKGLTEPIAPNNTEEGRKKNRRVEIFILEN